MKDFNISVITNMEANYPSEKECYSPSKSYPEYPFSDTVAKDENAVYDMVRESLYRLGLDQTHYGTKDWNPLGEYINPGNNVLLKPNWVMDFNAEPQFHDMDCLVTHPAVLRAAIDYVVIALKGTGRITVADAPMVECNLNHLFKVQHYDILEDYYKKHGVEVCFCDMRGRIIKMNPNKFEGNTVLSDEQIGIIIDLGVRSAFEELTDDQIKNLRALNNDPRILQKHHKRNKHEYVIHPYVIEADVIINLPKPKSHRKAGLTACGKNFVGANARKEYLPHADLEAKSQGGDMYLKKNLFYNLHYKLNDLYFTKRGDGINAPIVRIGYGLCRRIGQLLFMDPYWDGSWYGNDTIWRTIVDLNTVVRYSNRGGGYF